MELESSATNILKELMEQLKDDILQAYSSNVPIERTTGKTGEALEIKIDNETAQLLGYSYTGVLDEGRKAGRVPKGFYYIIKRWAIDKGISFSSQREFDTFCYFTARKTAEEGTRLFREGGRTDILQDNIAELEKQLADKVGDFYIEKITNNIFNKAKEKI